MESSGNRKLPGQRKQDEYDEEAIPPGCKDNDTFAQSGTRGVAGYAEAKPIPLNPCHYYNSKPKNDDLPRLGGHTGRCPVQPRPRWGEAK
jgi:hypothetical protein